MNLLSTSGYIPGNVGMSVLSTFGTSPYPPGTTIPLGFMSASTSSFTNASGQLGTHRYPAIEPDIMDIFHFVFLKDMTDNNLDYNQNPRYWEIHDIVQDAELRAMDLKLERDIKRREKYHKWLSWGVMISNLLAVICNIISWVL